MKGIIEEFSMTAVYLILGAVLIMAVISFSITDNTPAKDLADSHMMTAVSPRFTDRMPPELDADKLIYVRQGDVFNPMYFINKASDCNGISIKDRVRIYTKNGEYKTGDVDTSTTGTYRIRYAVQDEAGLWAWTDSTVEVKAKQ